MSNSPLVAVTILSPYNSGERTAAIDRITPHCVVGQCTAEGLGEWFTRPAVQASSNYGIDKDGRIGLYVPESCRSWCSSNSENDQRAITIECASDANDPYRMNDCVYTSLVNLCVDICQRNGKTRLSWIADKQAALSHVMEPREMLLTVHRWFANKSCPGDWLFSRLGDLAATVTAMLQGLPEDSPTPPTEPGHIYRVQLGAFRNRAYAVQMLEAVKAAGFTDAFITSN